ncbi:MAG: hypothetical protein DRI90_01155 [Deltaproteobacteria bacterium]|nr:MAG: hypothetical protein DRI90_01155 [Deltaproteobacteria bacterium]
MLGRWASSIFFALAALLIGGVVMAGQPPPKAPTKASAKAPARGALVIAVQLTARPHAKALARLVYQDAKLRPTIDEAMAQVLVGQEPPPGVPPSEGSPPSSKALARGEVAAVLRSLAGADAAVQKRLLTSMGQELGAALVVVVSAPQAGPTARVLQVDKGRFLAVTLAAKSVLQTSPKAATAFDWTDAVVILRGLVRAPPPGPRSAPHESSQRGPTVSDQGEEEGDGDFDLLTSPWFWTGLGVVVAVGVTVFILSQTTLEDPGVVVLEGRVTQ